MLTALIAQRELSKDVLDKANAVLKPMNGALTHGIGNSFVEAACWADDLENYSFDAFNTWHYIEKPYNYAGYIEATGSVINVLWAMEQCITSLSTFDSSASLLENSINMRLLLHFLGDVHQPLHVTNYWAEAFPHGDHLGTLFNVKFNGESVSLHDLWDSGLGQLSKEVARPLTKEGEAQLNTWADWVMGNFTRADLANELKRNTTQEWSDDSFHVAVQHAYAGITPDATPSASYLEAGWTAMMQQLALSGYRLADLLNSLYGTAVVAS